jgi:hypothetical protein
MSHFMCLFIFVLFYDKERQNKLLLFTFYDFAIDVEPHHFYAVPALGKSNAASVYIYHVVNFKNR